MKNDKRKMKCSDIFLGPIAFAVIHFIGSSACGSFRGAFPSIQANLQEE
jgi:hypothetical protein